MMYYWISKSKMNQCCQCKYWNWTNWRNSWLSQLFLSLPTSRSHGPSQVTLSYVCSKALKHYWTVSIAPNPTVWENMPKKGPSRNQPLVKPYFLFFSVFVLRVFAGTSTSSTFSLALRLFFCLSSLALAFFLAWARRKFGHTMSE
jgi:hypothetical protein